jgi:hypothetical protein
LTCGIPDVELNLSVVCEEGHGMHLNTESGNVLFLKLTGEMTFDESGFTDTSISNENKLELGYLLLSFDHLLKVIVVNILLKNYSLSLFVLRKKCFLLTLRTSK